MKPWLSVKYRWGKTRQRALRVVDPWRPWTRFPPDQIIDLPQFGRSRESEVALTFDDGPHPVHTPDLLRVLSNRGAKATFFMCGAAVKQFPAIVKEVAAEGHSIGGHTWSHRMLTGLAHSEIVVELDRTHEQIQQITGHPITLFRPPHLTYDQRVLALLRERRLTPVLASLHACDWDKRSATAISSDILRQVFNGAIVLLHDSLADGFYGKTCFLDGVDQSSTVAAVEEIILTLQGRGVSLVALATPAA